MYIPSHFSEQRPDALQALVTTNPLGTLVRQGAGGLCADHIPFLLAADGKLHAHMARANPAWRDEGPVLVVFQDQDAYVSPSLYEEKAVSGKVVPTWNYSVAHAHGTLRAVDDPAWLMQLLEALTVRHEGGRAAPWSIHDAPRDYIDKLLGAIVGIEITVDRWEGKFKRSQNRPLADQERINGEMGSPPSQG